MQAARSRFFLRRWGSFRRGEFAWPATGSSCEDVCVECLGEVGAFPVYLGGSDPEHRGSVAVELAVGAVGESAES